MTICNIYFLLFGGRGKGKRQLKLLSVAKIICIAVRKKNNLKFL